MAKTAWKRGVVGNSQERKTAPISGGQWINIQEEKHLAGRVSNEISGFGVSHRERC